MGRNYVDISGILLRQMIQYDSYNDHYRIERPDLEMLVELLNTELESMKRKEQSHG